MNKLIIQAHRGGRGRQDLSEFEARLACIESSRLVRIT